MSLPIQKSATNCAIVNSEIGNQKLYHCQFRNWQQNYVAANLEINSQKRFCCRFRNQHQNCHCQFKNRQPTMPLPNKKSATQNSSTTDSEIGSKTASLPIQKSKAKNCAAADSKISSDGGVISALVLSSSFFSFFVGVYNNDGGNMLQRNNYDSVKSISSSKPRVGYNNKKCYCCHKKVHIQFYYRRLKSVLKD